MAWCLVKHVRSLLIVRGSVSFLCGVQKKRRKNVYLALNYDMCAAVEKTNLDNKKGHVEKYINNFFFHF